MKWIGENRIHRWQFYTISLPFAFMSEEVSIIDEMIDLKPFIMVVFVVVVKKVVFDCDIRLNDLNEYMIEWICIVIVYRIVVLLWLLNRRRRELSRSSLIVELIWISYLICLLRIWWSWLEYYILFDNWL